MKLYLGGFFTFYLAQEKGWVEIDLPHPLPLRQVLEAHGIPPAEVHLVVVNGELVEMDGAVVAGQDVVKIYPPVGGGNS